MNVKINILRAILIILLIALFNFSGQEGEKSVSLSWEVTETVTKNVKAIQKLENSKKEMVLGKFEHIIRKIAHFSLYTLVGILTMSLMSTYDLKQMKRVGVSFGVGVLYAISDEIHQSFIPGRTSMVGDVFIDSCGVVFGIGIIWLMFRICKKITSKIS